MQLKNFENPKMSVEISQIDIEPQKVTEMLQWYTGYYWTSGH